MPLFASTQTTHTRGSLRGGVCAPQRGVWGSEPPDPGSAHKNNTRNPQILIIVPTGLHQPLLPKRVVPTGSHQPLLPKRISHRTPDQHTNTPHC
jgi:hypothetical protein